MRKQCRIDCATTVPRLSRHLPQCVPNVTALGPPQFVVLASSSSHNEGVLVSLPLQWVEEMNADV